MSSLSFDPFAEQRKNGFLIEWRVSSPSPLLDALQSAQQHLTKIGGTGVSVPQSCASNNFHATLNEFPLKDAKQLATVRALLKNFSETRIPQLVAEEMMHSAAPAAASASASVSKTVQQQQQQQQKKNDDDDDGDGKTISKSNNNTTAGKLPAVTIEPALRDFRGNVLYVAGQSSFLQRVYVELHSALHAAGFVPTPKPQRDLVVHLTLGRVQKGAQGDSNFLAGVLGDEYWAKNLAGLTDVGEICFCSRRFGAEPTPPLIFNMFPASQ